MVGLPVTKYDFVLLRKDNTLSLRKDNTLSGYTAASQCPKHVLVLVSSFQMWPSITLSSFSFQQPPNQHSLKTLQELQMLSPSLFIQGSQCICIVLFLSNAALHGSHGLSTQRAQRTKSSRPEGPKASPKGHQLEVEAQRAPKLLVYIYLYSLILLSLVAQFPQIWSLTNNPMQPFTN